jgi:ferritin-like metal-binding protein YciE
MTDEAIPMSIDTLRDVFCHELGVAYDAEQQMIGMIDQIEMEALSTEFRDRMRLHRTETLHQIDNLERCFEFVGSAPPHVRSGTVRGIRADREAFDAQQPSTAALEAYNLHAVDRLAHYKGATYRLLATLAQLVGYDDARRLLEQNLQDEEQVAQWIAERRERLLTEAAAPPARGAGNGRPVRTAPTVA